MAKSKARHKIAPAKVKTESKPGWINTLTRHPNILPLFISLFLAVAILVAFWPIRSNEFIILDDDEYVTENPFLKTKIPLQKVAWAFTTTYASNWHPLTWLSHMLDFQLFGLNPSGHHLTSLLFHLMNSLLLFWAFKRMTGNLWGSGLIAALFALHPLHVESVAWVAERKDVLSTFFWILTMGAYACYVERPSLSRYGFVLLSFILGLLSKPMLVTLPFVLLLLDYWPLGRFQIGQSGCKGHPSISKPARSNDSGPPALRLILEKIPFFLLSAISSGLTVYAQQRGGAVESLEWLPLGTRIANALLSYIRYIGKMIWPHSLAIYYPYPEKLPLWQVAGAGLLLGSISAFVIYLARKRPSLVVGWLWYLGTLVPVIGLVQVGMQAMADRYTYVPLIGLFIMIAMGIPDLLTRWRYQKRVLGISAGLLLFILMIVTRAQVNYWQNSIRLFEHTLTVVPHSTVIHNNLGIALAGQGKNQEAIAHYTEALRINPNNVDAHQNLGNLLSGVGKAEEAIHHFSKVLQFRPHSAEIHNSLGVALVRQGKTQEAMSHFSEALRIKPDYAEVYSNMGSSSMKQGKMEEGISFYKRAVQIKPNLAEAHYYLGLAYSMVGDRDSALTQYKILKTINPDLANTLYPKIFK